MNGKIKENKEIENQSDIDTIESNGNRKKGLGRKKQFKGSQGINGGVVGVALVMAVFLGVVLGAYAQKEGFFLWAKKSDTGSAVVISANVEVLSADVSGRTRYTSYDEIPEEYRNAVWDDEVLPEGLCFECAEIYSNDAFTNIESFYSDAGSKNVLYVSQKIFKNEIRSDLIFDSYEYIYTRTLQKTEIDFLQAMNDDDYKYIAYFHINDTQYIIRSEMESEEIESLIKNLLDVTI